MKYNILYVDDEESNLRVFKNAFRRDFQIHTTNSARSALEILNNTHIHVVITDQKMPEITGVELLGIINQKFSDIPPNRMILSGFCQDENIKLAFDQYKLFKFILKPWDYETLKKLIFEAIECH